MTILDKKCEKDIKWKNVLIFVYLHAAAIYGCFLPMLRSSIIIGLGFGIFAGFGTTVGAHRLFTHRTFKANKILKILMVILQTMSGQEPVIRWVSGWKNLKFNSKTFVLPQNRQETIESITNLLTPTLIRITLVVDSFSRTLDGFWSKNILMWSHKGKRLIWAIWKKIQWCSFRKSKFQYSKPRLKLIVFF